MKKDYSEAHKIAEKTVTLKPKDSMTWIAVGLALEHMGVEYHKKSEEAYLKSVKIDKNDSLPSFFLACYYLNTERAIDSEKWIEMALKNIPADFAEKFSKFHSLIQSAKYEEAKKQTQEFIDGIIRAWQW